MCWLLFFQEKDTKLQTFPFLLFSFSHRRYCNSESQRLSSTQNSLLLACAKCRWELCIIFGKRCEEVLFSFSPPGLTVSDTAAAAKEEGGGGSERRFRLLRLIIFDWNFKGSFVNFIFCASCGTCFFECIRRRREIVKVVSVLLLMLLAVLRYTES